MPGDTDDDPRAETTEPSTDPWMTVAEVAEYVRSSEWWVREQVKSGRLRTNRALRTHRIRRSWVDHLLEQMDCDAPS